MRISVFGAPASKVLPWLWRLLVTFCFVVPILLAGQKASGMIFSVTDTNDTVKGPSLRAAIVMANRLGGNNTIMLGQPGSGHAGVKQLWTFHLTLSGADEDAALTGDLDVTRGNLTILGAEPDVVIDASALGDRIFQVFPKARLTLQNLVVTGGHALGYQYGYFGPGEAGGAVYNSGYLILNNCVVVANASGDGNYLEGNGGGEDAGDAGGIYNSGTLIMNNCVMAGNFAGSGTDGSSGGNGGGIRNDGTCELMNCVFYDNMAGNGGAPEGNALGFAGSGGSGGAVFNAGMMTIISCAISNNVSGDGENGGESDFSSGLAVFGASGGLGGDGAGIYNSGQMNLSFCTINGNTNGSGGMGAMGIGFKGGHGGAGGSGAGVYNGGSASINTCTIGENVCGDGAAGGVGYPYGGDGGQGGGGGGIFNAVSLTILSSTIAGNVGGSGGNGGFGVNGFFGSGQGGSGGISGLGGGGDNIGDDSLRNTLIALNRIGTNGVDGNVGNMPPASPPGTNPPVSSTLVTVPLPIPGSDVAGKYTSLGFNLIGAGEGATGFTNGLNADQVGNMVSPIDPFIGQLQMNGGSTPTYALLPGSLAIDRGKSFGVRTDQRGFGRPYNYPLIPNAPSGDGSDIGAYELHPR
jgi:hypothetical protein